MLSHTQLRRWYTYFNWRWFDGALPEDMDVLYAPMDDAHGLAECHPNEERIITIDTMYAGAPRIAKLTLFHEMNHHYTGQWNHGAKFQLGMVRLAMIGAFKNIW